MKVTYIYGICVTSVGLYSKWKLKNPRYMSEGPWDIHIRILRDFFNTGF